MSEDMKIRWPVGRCLIYTIEGMAERIRKYGEPVLLLKEEFDELSSRKRFKDGPYIDDFGSGWCEPYVSNGDRQAFGIARPGRKNVLVYCELNLERNELIKKRRGEIFKKEGEVKDLHRLTKLLVGEDG